jgi:GNAT superfamily N-acetyltransferase
MISKRPAIETDKPFLVWLEATCMREYAIALWRSWSPDLIVRNSVDGCHIIADDGHDVGCVTVERHSDHLWLDELFIEPAFQRRGIGSKILRSVIADAEGLEIPLRLSVLTTNPALNFYLRHGFLIHRETAERRYLVR